MPDIKRVPLDLKYRPWKFSEILGNKGVTRLLLKRSQDKTLDGRSMMFGGPKGCGKTSAARVVSAALSCSSVIDGEPCGNCQVCIDIHSGSSQLVEEFDAASYGTVDRARSMVSEADYESFGGGPRIHIMDEAHGLSKQAQGALLKSVEDRSLILILCTTDPDKILPAIRNRVEEYPISPPKPEEVVDWLYSVCRAESVRATPEALELVVKANGCCPRSSLLAVDSASVMGPVTVDSVKSFLRVGSMEAVVRILDSLDSDVRSSLNDLEKIFASEGPGWVRDNLVAAITGAMRISVGSRSSYPVSCSFYPRRGRSWADLAVSLGRLERPSVADVEAVLLSSCSGLPVTGQAPPTAAPSPIAEANRESDPPRPPKIVPVPSPKDKDHDRKKDPQKETPKLRQVEVDGVVFSQSEHLTSLDGKITPVKRESAEPPVQSRAPVEFGADHAPIPFSEFSQGLAQRLNRTP